MIFLSYYPLKQGLKLNQQARGRQSVPGFLSYYPLKQGLKPFLINFACSEGTKFLSYYPLNPNNAIEADS